MRIVTNMEAMRTQSSFRKDNDKLTKNLRNLSSGYKINHAADDAAGLGISEKMRALIAGLSQADNNSADGINLIQVGEGALQEVDSMLDRIKEMAVQSANGTYSDEVDREGLQAELEEIVDEVDRISATTNFNNIPLFWNEHTEDRIDMEFVPYVPEDLLAEEFNTPLTESSSEHPEASPDTPNTADTTATAQNTSASPSAEGAVPLFPSSLSLAAEGLDSADPEAAGGLQNIVYTETVYEFVTEQSAAGAVNSFSDAEQRLADTVKTQILPNVVKGVLDKYPAFNYLEKSSIGIGLRLFSDNSGTYKNTLAYVNSGIGQESYTKETSLETYQNYQLGINIAKIGNGGNIYDDSAEAADARNALERTIAHEMIHAFMDEAATAGMHGKNEDFGSEQRFPMWFIEGMAQTASGPGNWVSSMGITESITDSEYFSIMQNPTNKLSSSNSETAAQYGTGYLACMYLGYKAYLNGGSEIDWDNPEDAAKKISDGISEILTDIIKGNSLEETVKKNIGGCTSLSQFEDYIATGYDPGNFILHMLAKYTTDGQGGLISGDLSEKDPVPNVDITDLELFELDTGNDTVKNIYPSGVNIISGGDAVKRGTSALYPDDLFTVTGGTEGEDYTYDNTTGTLTVLTSKKLNIKGGYKEVDGIAYVGKIVFKNNIGSSEIELSGIELDFSKEKGDNAGIEIGEGNNVRITLSGNNTIKASGYAAGIQLPGYYEKINPPAAGSTLTIDGEGTLDVTGGTILGRGGAAIGTSWACNGENSDITVKSGTINAYGGMGGAGIGGSEGGNIGNILIEGGRITALGGEHGAGIGSGGWVSEYSRGPQNVKSITITGGDITASSKSHGTGIGSGCHGSTGNIKINETTGATVIHATGGSDAAGIGAGWDSKGGDITIEAGKIFASGGNKGAGIGVGYQSSGGNIAISGGTVVATGGRQGAGIGCAPNGELNKITISGSSDVYAKGDTDSSGIGGAQYATIQDIEISGGMVTAYGGLTNDGGNIGGYKSKGSGAQPAKIVIKDPTLTIKAGRSGEGLYNTTGTVDLEEDPIYAFKLDFEDYKDYFDPNISDMEFPVSITSTVTKGDGTTVDYSWSDKDHLADNGFPKTPRDDSDYEHSVYIWMKGGENYTAKLKIKDKNGDETELDLRFYPNAGLWRPDGVNPPDAEKPKYSNGTEPPDGGSDIIEPNNDDPNNDEPKKSGDDTKRLRKAPKGIILQVGANTGNTFVVPQFHFSASALKMGELDISTQDNALKTMDRVEKIISTVLSMRGQYGALQNALEHIINNLDSTTQNLTAAESQIRDLDMAKEITDFTKNNILSQSAQSMLAQANAKPEGILSLLQ